jgi:very-short-patch-repair endonuclease
MPMQQQTFLTRQQLRAQGYTVERIRADIEAGLLERVIRGWYCRPGADRTVVQAMRLGGRLSCVSALRLYGAWSPPDVGLHLGFPSHASGRRRADRATPEGVVSHWHPKDAATGSSFAVTPMARSIEDLLVCQPAHFVAATLDSLLNKRLIQRNRVDALILAGPHRMRYLADHLHPGSESGIESIVRFLLASAGIRASIQVVLRERYRVDLLIDGWLVVEIDGRATHTRRKDFTRDHVRAATLMRDGRLVLAFAYATVMYDWDFVLASILDVMTQHAPVSTSAG